MYDIDINNQAGPAYVCAGEDNEEAMIYHFMM